MEMKIEEIKEAVWQLKKDKAIALVKQALEEGLNPVEILQSGVIAGLQVVGEKFGAKEYFLAELVMGGKVSEPCIELITPHLPESVEGRLGTVVIGAVKGDLHTIGYGLVTTQLELAGFKVHKLGIDLPSMTFIDKAKEFNADIIGLSAFLVTTIPYCKEVIGYLQDMNLQDKYKVIIGGAETSAEKAEAMDADGWALNAVQAVSLCRRLMGKEAPAGDWWFSEKRVQ
jgi:5-methyltetrahydrofolate--homocysteine methyltransferase